MSNKQAAALLDKKPDEKTAHTVFICEIIMVIVVLIREWRETMEQCLIAVYGEAVGKQEAEAMMILITGTFLCNYNGVLTGGINHNIIGYLSNLAKS